MSIEKSKDNEVNPKPVITKVAPNGKGTVCFLNTLSWDVGISDGYEAEYDDGEMILSHINGMGLLIHSLEIDFHSRIASAALMHGDTIIPVLRHSCEMTAKILEGLNIQHRNCIQGFINGYGQFVTRRVAMHIAFAHSQLKWENAEAYVLGSTEELYSECIY